MLHEMKDDDIPCFRDHFHGLQFLLNFFMTPFLIRTIIFKLFLGFVKRICFGIVQQGEKIVLVLNIIPNYEKELHFNVFNIFIG